MKIIESLHDGSTRFSLLMLVTIITACHNSAKTIGDTLSSVLRQTYADIEYIVIDGGSTDATVQIIKDYEPRFQGRLKWVSEPDRGIYDAMNKGIARSHGDVIGILNSDDFFTSDDVITLMVKAFTPDVDAVYGDVHFVREQNLHRSVRYYSGRVFRPWLVKYGFIAPHPSFYIRRELFRQYGGYDERFKISADFELIARFFYKERRPAKYLHLDFVTMRIGGASTRDWQARLLGTREDIIACRNLGIRTCKLNIWCKYIIKTWESLFIRK